MIMVSLWLLTSTAFSEEPASAEETEEVAPIPVEKVEEIEGPKEAKEDSKEKEEIPTSDKEAIEDAVELYKAVESKNWPLASGFLVMLLVYAFNRFGLKDKIGSKAIPWVSLVLGVLSSVGVALASGSPLSAALAAGVTAGLAAIGSWETVFKNLLSTKNVADS